jgi:hypothetical protein
MHGLPRVMPHHHEYDSIKLEDSSESPIKFEDGSEEWQQHQLMQHVDPIQPFVCLPFHRHVPPLILRPT